MTRLLRGLVAALLVLAPVGVVRPAAAGAIGPVAVAISGQPVVGDVVTAVVTSDEPGTVTYQWTRAYNHSGVALDFPGATRPSFTPTAYFRGKVLGVRVTHTPADGEATTVIRTVGVVRPGTLGAVKVTLRGAATPGSVLRAIVTRPSSTPPGYQASLRWYAGNGPISVDGRSATGPRLRLTPALVGRYDGQRLHVRVKTAAPGYRSGSMRSRPTQPL